MGHLAAFLFGSALGILFLAGSHLLAVRIGVSIFTTTVCLSAVGVVLIASSWTRPRKQKRGHFIWPLSGLALAAYLSPAWLSMGQGFLLNRVQPGDGTPETFFWLFLTSFLCLGILAYPAGRLLNKMAHTSGDDSPRHTAIFFATVVAGAALSLILAPALLYQILGVTGGIRTAATAILAAGTFTLLASHRGETIVVDHVEKRADPIPVLLAIALSMGAAPLLARTDPALGGTVTASLLGPMLLLGALTLGLLLGGICTRSSAHHFVSVLALIAATILIIASELQFPSFAGVLENHDLVAAVHHDHPTERLSEALAIGNLHAFLIFCLAILVIGIALVSRDIHTTRGGLILPFGVALFLTPLFRLIPNHTLNGILLLGTGAALVAACATTVLLKRTIDDHGHRPWIPSIVGACVLLIGLWPWFSPEEEHRLESEGVRSEADGTVVNHIQEDGEISPRQNGVPIRSFADSEAALRRSCLMLLTLTEEPEKILVLGPGAGPLVAALREVQRTPVTWVTPLRSEANEVREPIADGESEGRASLDIVNAHERNYVESTTDRFGLIIIAPPSVPVRRNGMLLTREFQDLVREHLTDTGIAAQLLPLASLDPRAVIADFLPSATATHDDFVIFLDHPMSPEPWAMLAYSRQRFDIRPERLSRRTEDVAAHADDLEKAGLDADGIIQNYVFDREIIRFRMRRPWSNDDDRPFLASQLQPLKKRAPGISRDLLMAFSGRRSSPEERLWGAGMNREEFQKVVNRVRTDHDAINHLLSYNVTLQKEYRTGVDPSLFAVRDHEELERFLIATRLGPKLRIPQVPIERFIQKLIEDGDIEASLETLSRLDAVVGGRADLRFLIGNLEERRQNVLLAREYYRRALERDPTHTMANLQLGLILAGGSPRVRDEARVCLERALETNEVPKVLRAKAEVALAFASGDHDRARELLARLTSAPPDALLDFIRMRIDL